MTTPREEDLEDRARLRHRLEVRCRWDGRSVPSADGTLGREGAIEVLASAVTSDPRRPGRFLTPV